MHEFSFTVTEHDTDRPWIVVAYQHRVVRLEDGVSFYDWAHERWPEPRWTVQLDPWQLTQARAGAVTARRSRIRVLRRTIRRIVK